MKKVLLFCCLLLPVSWVSCDKFDLYKNHKLDGMWQLKTVQDIDGKVVFVDTIYYSFQRAAVFSFTVLETPTHAMQPIYGYVDMPSDDRVHVLIDYNSAKGGNFEWFHKLSGWSSLDVTFDIKKYNNTDLVLFDSGNGKTYTLKKF